MNQPAMQLSFESEKNKKALVYTLIICGVLLLLAFIITFPVMKVTPPLVLAQDLMEINLGNNDEGFGEKQPLIKGEMNANAAPQPAPKQVNNSQAAAEEDQTTPDDNAEEDAAPEFPVLQRPYATETILDLLMRLLSAPGVPSPGA